MKNLEQTIEKSFLDKVRNSLNRIKPSVVGKLAVYSLAGVLGAGLGYGCGSEEEQIIPGGGGDIGVLLNTPAGTVGKCIEVEIYPGYTTCIMDKSQHLETETERGMLRLALNGELPDKVNHETEYIDANCPTVHDQRKCGWCVAHATTAAMEALECKTKKSERISEPHLWYVGGGNVSDCVGGWYIESAIYRARENKLVAGLFWPYSIGKMAGTKPSDEDLLKNGKYSVGDYTLVGGHNTEEVKTALAGGNNVIYSVPVFHDVGWFAKDLSYKNIVSASIKNSEECENIEAIEKCKNGQGKKFCCLGYHALLLVGYDDTSEKFRLRNSWGSGWADKGYANISYGYIEKFGRGGAYPIPCNKEEEICDGKDNDCDGETDEDLNCEEENGQSEGNDCDIKKYYHPRNEFCSEKFNNCWTDCQNRAGSESEFDACIEGVCYKENVDCFKLGCEAEGCYFIPSDDNNPDNWECTSKS